MAFPAALGDWRAPRGLSCQGRGWVQFVFVQFQLPVKGRAHFGYRFLNNHDAGIEEPEMDDVDRRAGACQERVKKGAQENDSKGRHPPPWIECASLGLAEPRPHSTS